MAARPLHLFEAGVITERQFSGLQEAPAALGPLLAERLGAEKRVRIPFNPRDRWLSAAREACRTLADGVLISLREARCRSSSAESARSSRALCRVRSLPSRSSRSSTSTR